MAKARIYLDMCCFNRPYDDQSQLKIELETKAKLFIQQLVLENSVSLVWSYMLDYENSLSDFMQKQSTIQKWQEYAVKDIDESTKILQISNKIQKTGIKNADSLHIACAISADCDYFISVDKRLLNYQDKRIIICDPIEFLRIWEGLAESYDEQ